MVARFNDLLLNGANKCNMLKTEKYAKKSTKTSKNKDWFNACCHDKRIAFNRAGRRYQDNRSEENLTLLKLMGKEYKTIIYKCKAVHRQNIVADLKEKLSGRY